MCAKWLEKSRDDNVATATCWPRFNMRGKDFRGNIGTSIAGPLSARDGPVGVGLCNYIICMTPVCIILPLSGLGEQ